MKRLLFFLICLKLPTFAFGQNEIKSLEERMLLKQAKVKTEKSYYTDSIESYKNLVTTIEYNNNGDVIKYEHNYVNQKATVKIFFEFDSLYILRKKTYCFDSLCNHHLVEEYDEKRHVVKSSFYDQSGTLSSSGENKYNDKGYIIEESTNYPPTAISKNMYSYDNKDSLIQVVSKDKDGKVTYDSKVQKSGDNYFDETPRMSLSTVDENKTFYPNGKVKSIESFDGQNNLIAKEFFLYDNNGNSVLHEIEYYGSGLLVDKTIIKNRYNEQSLIVHRQVCESGSCTIMLFEYEFFN